VSVIGALRDDAALTSLPVKTGRGRPRKKGTPLPKPREMAQQRQRWSRTVAEMYGQQAVVRYLSVVAQWYGGAGPSPLRIVVVKTERGQMPVRVFFSTDADLAVEELLHSYACRWSVVRGAAVGGAVGAGAAASVVAEQAEPCDERRGGSGAERAAGSGPFGRVPRVSTRDRHSSTRV
jgi:hypothetical protein